MQISYQRSPFEYRKKNMNNSVLIVQDVKELSERIKSHTQSLLSSMKSNAEPLQINKEQKH